MSDFIASFEMYFSDFVHFFALLVELVGALVIIVSVIRAVKNIFAQGFNFENAKSDPNLNGGLTKALEIFLAGEILMTLLAEDLKMLAHVGALVIIRVAIAMVIHWEAKQEEKQNLS